MGAIEAVAIRSAFPERLAGFPCRSWLEHGPRSKRRGDVYTKSFTFMTLLFMTDDFQFFSFFTKAFFFDDDGPHLYAPCHDVTTSTHRYVVDNMTTGCTKGDGGGT